jgi:putative transposase
LPRDDDDFPKRWASIKREFSRRYLAAGGAEAEVTANQAAHRQRGVWQPRYWEHRIRNEEEWYAYRDYIHLNPVRHGYVDDPLKWPWSSVHRHLQLGWLADDWTAWSPIDAPVGEP